MKLFLAPTVGALLFFSATAQAEPEFVPSGSIGFSQTFYGNSGKYKTATARPSLTFEYNFSHKWSISADWDRAWGMFDDTGVENQQYQNLSQPSATINYNYGNLGDSKVNWSSSLMLQNQKTMGSTSTNYMYGQTAFDFSGYLPKTDLVQSTQFAIAPQYVHGWNSKGGSGYVNTAGVGLLTEWQLSANFSLTVDAYWFKDWYSGAFTLGSPKGSYSNASYFAVLAWLQYQKTLFNFTPKTALDFNFIGGVDPYMASNRRAVGWEPFIASNAMYEWLGPTVQTGNYKSTYTAFALPQLTLTHQIDKQFSASVFLQAKYSNQIWGATQGGWRLQPQGGFGLSYSF